MWAFTCRCGMSITERPDMVLSCCEDLEHKHECVLRRVHTKEEPCLCSCGATMRADEDVWRDHEHHCITAKEHRKAVLCLCSCGAVRDMLEEDPEWEESI
jgi:hypothetical protein